jgi:hypothetical protein
LLSVECIITRTLHQRCGICNTDDGCKSEGYNVGLCTAPFCDPCSGICSGSYRLTQTDKDAYTMETFRNDICTGRIGVSTTFCSTCKYLEYYENGGCPEFFLLCKKKSWWPWLLGLGAVGLAAVAIVVVVAGIYHKKCSNGDSASEYAAKANRY